MHLFFICFFLYVFLFFYLFIFFCAVHCFPITSQNAKKNKSKIQTPKSRSKSASALGQTQKLRPDRLKHLNPLLPLILIKKLGCLPHVFSFFFLSSKLRFFSLCGSLGLPSHRKTLKKKNRESSPQGALPPVVNRISPP